MGETPREGSESIPHCVSAWVPGTGRQDKLAVPQSTGAWGRQRITQGKAADPTAGSALRGLRKDFVRRWVRMPKILIIDDEEAVRYLVSLTLGLLSGWTALSAASGSDGVKLAVAEAPDAILLDVMMPDMDGRQTLESLQSNPSTKAIPVLFLTASVRARDLEKLRALGAKAVITKPFDPMSLAGQIAQTLGWSA
ncbi:MAG: response regulator [Terriglobia bacterium]